MACTATADVVHGTGIERKWFAFVMRYEFPARRADEDGEVTGGDSKTPRHDDGINGKREIEDRPTIQTHCRPHDRACSR